MKGVGMMAVLGLMLCTSAAQAAGEVQLVHVTSSQCAPASGCHRTPYLRGTVEVQNLAYSKAVTVRYYSWNTGAWADAAASYVGPSTTGKELWSFDIGTVGATRFAIAYTVNGTTYWDNNGGQDYKVADYQLDALLTSPDISGATGQRDTSKSAVVGNLLVKNRGAQKAVTVVYTDDDWLTTKSAPAAYVATLPSGIEYWSFEAPVSTSAASGKVQLAFKYVHAYGTSWDNNYGHNYRLVNDTVSR
ncbi:CBM21 domain-containing protein [Archangium lipolyticum]|uniref:CBM21 domain-containing protein n=1 Tax=Archangium lipolyticum TaxID=2970465 RepID=UPI00214A5499|nr:CBM21 domain-containing protein [Archangium lipolyticum]